MKALFSLLLLLAYVLAPSLVAAQALPRSSPEAQGIASGDILAFVEAADREIDTMNSFMLVRNGHVVAEAWWAPYGPENPHILYSLSKSFTSTAVGLAIAEGRLGLHDPVLSFFPEDAPPEPSDNLKAMRVRDLLRMAAGHDVEVSLNSETPWTQQFLAHPVPHIPGTHFKYNTPATYMLSAIVQKVTGQTVLDYLRPRLFEPLGIDNPIWGTSPQGITLGGYGLSIRTEDIARFGQLYLQKGEWNGRQLIPEEWAKAATSLQVSNGSNPESDWHQGYGYQFWRSRHNTYRGDGAFGQYCMVIPEHDAVIAITSGVRDMQAVMNLVWDKLLPALRAAPLPEDAAAHRQLQAKLAGLAVRPVEGRPTTARAKAVSGQTFTFSDNERGLQSARLDFDGPAPTLVVQTAQGESRIPVGTDGRWRKGRSAFVNGLERFVGMPDAAHAVAATGAWTSDDIFTVKLVLPETPYYTTLAFDFSGDQLLIEGEHNVAFGQRQVPQLVGR